MSLANALSFRVSGPFIIAILILAFAAGFIKPSLAPLLCDQSPVTHPTIKTLKTGERVVVDPSATVHRYMLFVRLHAPSFHSF